MKVQNLKRVSTYLPSIFLSACFLLNPFFTAFSLAQTVPSQAIPCSYSNNFSNVEIEPSIPNLLPTTSQSAANCMAWQTFIALNWKADPNSPGKPDSTATASEFGNPETPNNIDPVVWETYKEASEMIGPNVAEKWESPQALPESFLQAEGIQDFAPASSFGFKPLTATSKFADGPDFVLDGNTQAFTNSWLTAQNQSLTFYEIRVNKDEYEYITDNQLAIPQNQKDCAEGGAGLSLPSNVDDKSCVNKVANYGADGAIEIKASWVELKDPSLYKKYKIAKAIIKEPDLDIAPREAVMGLVGLHIIHKVPNAQQFVWATFEHIDNAPNSTEISNKKLRDSYMYYNPQCDPSTDHYQCKENAQPKPSNNDPYSAPVQVVRLNAIPTSSNDTNSAVWADIRKSNNESVFLNYQLIDTMWPNANQTIEAGANTPLSSGGITSGTLNNYVANTTMETYFQDPKQQPKANNVFNPGGCLGCHVLAPVASTRAKKTQVSLSQSNIKALRTSSPSLAADYSFLFSTAKATRNSPQLHIDFSNER